MLWPATCTLRVIVSSVSSTMRASERSGGHTSADWRLLPREQTTRPGLELRAARPAWSLIRPSPLRLNRSSAHFVSGLRPECLLPTEKKGHAVAQFATGAHYSIELSSVARSAGARQLSNRGYAPRIVRTVDGSQGSVIVTIISEPHPHPASGCTWKTTLKGSCTADTRLIHPGLVATRVRLCSSSESVCGFTPSL
jgi:hypothetical protein